MYFLEYEPENGNVSDKIPIFTTPDATPEGAFVTFLPEEIIIGRYFLMNKQFEGSYGVLEAVEIELHVIH